MATASRRSTVLALALAAVPFAFGALRFANTGSDSRYLIMAVAAAAVAALLLTFPANRLGLLILSTMGGCTATALIAARLLGARNYTSMAIVALAFAFFLTAAVVVRVKARSRPA